MSGVTTHVLDLVTGKPAPGVRVAVARIEEGATTPLGETVTNCDGRVDRPLLSGEELRAGVYELAFHVGDYFAAKSRSDSAEHVRFLDIVPLRFGVADPSLHYHVPLLVTPWSYSTYRGS